MNIDWEKVSADMDRRKELAKLPPDVLAADLQDAEDDLAQAWVPVKLAAELVRVDDVLVGKDRKLLMVEAVDDPRDRHGVAVGDVVRIHLAGHDKSWRLTRDRRVQVLVPYPDREALILLRIRAGAQITDRKNTGSES